MLYISKIRLQDVRCFDDVVIDLRSHGDPSGWTVFVGDNATGKSTLLRSIAMGLCDEASAAGLLKESDEGYIRRGKSKAKITIELWDPLAQKNKYRITTTVHRYKGATLRKGERGVYTDFVRQTTTPRRGLFPWGDIFVSGYGAGRGVAGTGDISAYSAIDAVYNLFSYTEGLQNPELTIRRVTDGRARRDREIFKMLCAFTGSSDIRLTRRGIVADGPWGEGMPLRDLADGYKSAFIWFTDLIGWSLAYKPKMRGRKGIRGIVLIDEVDQHLHARWQRTVVDDLRRLLPNVQFIASTHSPLIAAGVGDIESNVSRDKLIVLESRAGNCVQATEHEFMQGWRIDQVLASRAFKYQTNPSDDYLRIHRLASALLGKGSRTPTEERTLRTLQEKIKHTMQFGSSPIERKLEIELEAELSTRISNLEKKLFPDEHYD